MEKKYFENFDFEKIPKNIFSKNQKSNPKISKFWDFEFQIWKFDFSKKYFLEIFQIKIFKIFFLHDEKIFFIQFFWWSGI